MKRERLEALTNEELDAYAEHLGLSTKDKGKAAKVDAIIAYENRVVEIKALGFTAKLDIKRIQDLRNYDIKDRFDTKTSKGVQQSMRWILGDEQADALLDFVTDDDGVEDSSAYTFIVGEIGKAISKN